MAIGARCQSAKTYLEKNYETFPACIIHLVTKQELITHAIKAVKSSAQGDVELNGKSVTVGILGFDTPFKFLDPQDIESVLASLAQAMEVEV
jgi:20S proteasome subunit alpha 6